MAFKCIMHELREITGNKGENGLDRKHHPYPVSRSHIAPEISPSTNEFTENSRWANIPPELLLDIIQRVETRDVTWPARRDVIACASICKSWRDMTKQVVRLPEHCGLLTFPSSLKQAGQRESPIQCYLKRERATSSYLLYFGVSPASAGEFSKLLLAAKKIRRAAGTEFIISLAKDDFSQASNMYAGKLRSNFLGTNFTIIDRPSSNDPAALSKVVHPRKCGNSYSIGAINYELNVLKTRGPRRMNCVMHSIPLSTIQDEDSPATPTVFTNSEAKTPTPRASSKYLKPLAQCSPIGIKSSSSKTSLWIDEPLILKNKSPRWHEQLQCWCLNFKGRVSVASVKNFQLVASAKPRQGLSPVRQERVILQFGKIGRDIFTMDYWYPLSAFQAFAICLSSFDTKLACE